MARTRKPADTAAEGVIVQLRPEPEEPVAEAAEDLIPDMPDAVDEPPDPDAEPEERSRSRGPGLNRVELIGRMAKAPDIRVTPTGMHVAYFRVATNGRDNTEFHQCTAFGKTAEFLGEYLGVGRLVFIEGRLQTRPYDDRDGVRRWVTTIVVSRLQALDQRRPGEQ
jgi:single-strand DNA-binding protein